MSEREMAEMYRRVIRPKSDGSLAEAIRNHSQACGFVAYVCNVHPDAVARVVKEFSATEGAP